MIAVCIATYNHEAYIARAIRSVLSQQCDEELRVYLGDDASTDRTQDVCLPFAAQDDRIVYVRREQNLGLVNNTLELYRRILADRCTYIAMLDGDDYWTDNRKLQRQLDYLRTHPDVGLVHTAVEGQGDEAIPEGDLSRRYDLAGARQSNCTVLFRADLLRRVDTDALRAQNFQVLDYPLYGLFAQLTRFGYLPIPTAVWTSHESVSRPRSLRAQIHYRRERIRMWRWLDQCYPGRFHYRGLHARWWLLKQAVYLILS